MNNALHNLDCPPLMSDGRIATDYRPSCVVHTLINEQNKVANSHQSRGFLQANAVKLMTMNQTFFQDQFSCPSADRLYHVDPNNHDSYWKNYKQTLVKGVKGVKEVKGMM